MSTQAVRAAKPLVIVAQSAKAKPAKVKVLPPKQRPLQCHRKPGMHEEREIRDCVGAFLDNGRSLVESVELIRVYMMKMTLLRAKGVKKTAAANLKISRYHLDNYLVRGKGLL